jgi:hypothetical protein
VLYQDMYQYVRVGVWMYEHGERHVRRIDVHQHGQSMTRLCVAAVNLDIQRQIYIMVHDTIHYPARQDLFLAAGAGVHLLGCQSSPGLTWLALFHGESFGSFLTFCFLGCVLAGATGTSVCTWAASACLGGTVCC